MEMRSTQELREEIFRRAEHKKRAKRALYRRMGTLCLLLCLCTGVMVWGMLGQTAPEAGSSHSVTESSHGELLLPSESLQSGNTVSIDQAGQDQQTSAPMEYPEENLSAEESASAGESVSEEEIVPPEDEPDDPENPSEEGLLPTVVLLAVPAGIQEGMTNPLCTVQGVLTQGTSEFDAGDTLQLVLSTDLMLYGGESILAVGEWQNGVFVVEEGDWMLFCDEMEDEDSSVLEPDWEDPEFDPPTDEIEPPASEDVSRLDALLMMAGKYKPEHFSSTEDGKDLFEALKALYQP
jgi:hypothetical protein